MSGMGQIYHRGGEIPWAEPNPSLDRLFQQELNFILNGCADVAGSFQIPYLSEYTPVRTLAPSRLPHKPDRAAPGRIAT